MDTDLVDYLLVGCCVIGYIFGWLYIHYLYTGLHFEGKLRVK